MSISDIITSRYSLYGVIAVVVIISLFIIKKAVFKTRLPSPFDGFKEDASVMASEQMLGSAGLQSLVTGPMAGYEYNLMTNNSGRVMMLVTLDHDTGIHIVMAGDRSRIGAQFGLQMSYKWLEDVQLEGNFATLFRMYCTKGKQMEVREIFTPDVMQHFADFCRAYDFEIFGNMVYISQAQGAKDRNDKTTLVSDITQFLNHAKPTFDRLQATAAGPKN